MSDAQGMAKNGDAAKRNQSLVGRESGGFPACENERVSGGPGQTGIQ
ncbi:MAG: hypothetical protein V2G51_01855 [bacterium JZ-2024 1]